MSHCMHVHYLCDVHVCVYWVCVCVCACVCVCVCTCVCLHGGCVQNMCVGHVWCTLVVHSCMCFYISLLRVHTPNN